MVKRQHIFYVITLQNPIIDSSFGRLETDAWRKREGIEEKKFALVAKIFVVTRIRLI